MILTGRRKIDQVFSHSRLLARYRDCLTLLARIILEPYAKQGSDIDRSDRAKGVVALQDRRRSDIMCLKKRERQRDRGVPFRARRSEARENNSANVAPLRRAIYPTHLHCRAI